LKAEGKISDPENIWPHMRKREENMNIKSIKKLANHNDIIIK
tara:strand:+ start:406 stop:531 length:126 start_codon:yes stop_codon:yes gene_type:complete